MGQKTRRYLLTGSVFLLLTSIAGSSSCGTSQSTPAAPELASRIAELEMQVTILETENQRLQREYEQLLIANKELSTEIPVATGQSQLLLVESVVLGPFNEGLWEQRIPHDLDQGYDESRLPFTDCGGYMSQKLFIRKGEVLEIVIKSDLPIWWMNLPDQIRTSLWVTLEAMDDCPNSSWPEEFIESFELARSNDGWEARVVYGQEWDCHLAFMLFNASKQSCKVQFIISAR